MTTKAEGLLFQEFSQFRRQFLASQALGHHVAILVEEEVGRDVINHVTLTGFVLAVAHLRPRQLVVFDSLQPSGFPYGMDHTMKPRNQPK